MPLDPYHYRRALAPHGLRTIAVVAGAIGEAIANAQTAGLRPEDCPAVRLLLRHQQRILDGADLDAQYAADDDLRAECDAAHDAACGIDILPELLSKISLSSGETNLLVRTARKRLHQLTARLGYGEGDYQIERRVPAVGATEIHLFADRLQVRISRPVVAGFEILYRRSRYRFDEHGGRESWAPISALNDPRALAATINQRLELGHVQA